MTITHNFSRCCAWLIAAAAAALPTIAQSSLDLTSQMSLRRQAVLSSHPQALQSRSLSNDKDTERGIDSGSIHSITTPTTNLALVRLTPGCSAEDLQSDGFDAVPLRGGFALVTCEDPENAMLLSNHSAVSKCEFNRQRRPLMDNARRASGVDLIHHGKDLPLPYTGKGVITGIVDGGFDPNHVNFMDAEGNTRFRYFSTVEITGSGTGVRVTPYTPEQLSRFTSDDSYETHGTHTLGIMSGSFNGESTVGFYDDDSGLTSVETTSNPFYGVAPESTIYASSGSQFDALIAYAIDGILEYRWNNDHDTPIVINLSLGGNQGPHDGSGLLSQYIDAVTQSDNAIFCISAGNEGDIPLALNKTFIEDDLTVGTFIRPYVYSDVRYGMVEMYSDTAQDFDVSVIIYNKARGRVARTFPLNNKDGQIQYLCSSAEYMQDESDIIDSTFATAYDGYVGIGARMDQESGRFYAAIDYYVTNSDKNPATPGTTEAQYTLGFVITGNPGQRVDCYCDGTFTALDSYGYNGYVDGTCNGTISDMATTKSAIAVGSYNTREWASNLEGHMLGYDGYFIMDEVTEFSSFGTLVDGRELPHLLAPGCTVVSSVSTPYLKNPNSGANLQTMSAMYDDGKRQHYYTPMMGTSMSSPFVAGTVALMLEANPTLDYQTVRDILMETATKDFALEIIDDPVQGGAGKLNAYEALKAVTRLSSLPGVSIDSDKDNTSAWLRPMGHRNFNVFLPSSSKINIDIYTIDGRKVWSRVENGDEINLDLSSLPRGVYILTVNGTNSQRIALR